MLSVFIFKSNARGMQFGMGTYIRELTEALLFYPDIKIYIVNYHSSEFTEVKIDTISERYFNIYVPSPDHPSSLNTTNLSDKRYASAIVNILAHFIPTEGDVIFQINYIDGLSILKKLKEKYVHPVISVVHFAQWQELFKGNKQKLTGLNIDQPTNDIEFTLFSEKEMYLLSDRIISVTQYMKEFLVNHYRIDSSIIDVVPNGINYSKYKFITQEERLKIKNDLGFRHDEKLILFSGRIDPSKGIYPLLDAFVESCKHLNNLKLVIAGQGYYQECIQRHQSIFGKVVYAGFLPQNRLEQLLQIADVGIVPSVYDHCPYTILEMIANKIPLILAEINGITEILNKEQCVFIKPKTGADGSIYFDTIELSKKIVELIKNKDSHSLSDLAFSRLKSKFNPRLMGDNTLAVYKLSCGNKSDNIIATDINALESGVLKPQT